MYAAGQHESLKEPRPARSHTSSTLHAFRRLRASGRPRTQSYRTLDGLSAGRDAVAWYWRLVGMASTFMILGGFLMLPATFEKKPDMRVTQAALGIFAVALLTAGLLFTALLAFAVRNPLFQADNIFLPAFTSCALGFLTVFYNFLVFNRYSWNTPALLVTVGAAISTIVYGGLLVWTQRKVGVVKSRVQYQNQHQHQHLSVPMAQLHTASQPPAPAPEQEQEQEQEQTYYKNYNQNMFPSAYSRLGPPVTPGTGYDPDSITEKEMQRQQMLMLLLTKDPPSTPAPSSSSTFHIDWQGREEEDAAPANGWYAPPSATSSVYPPTADPSPGITRQHTSDLTPWDGVWREVRRPQSQDFREARRREIEESSRRS